MQTHEACRAIVSAVQALQAEPLTHKGKELLSVIARNANEAAEEIEYLQTAATVLRQSPPAAAPLPEEYNAALLTPAERRVLETLWASRGKAVTHEALFFAARGFEYESAEAEAAMEAQAGRCSPLKIVAVQACRIRRVLNARRSALEALGYPSYINAAWGRGYILSREPYFRALSSTVRVRKIYRKDRECLEFFKKNPRKPVTLEFLYKLAGYSTTESTPHRRMVQTISLLRKTGGADIRLVKPGVYAYYPPSKASA